MPENPRLRDGVLILTAVAVIASAIVFVMQIRGDLDEYILADHEHQEACANERKQLRRDLTRVEQQVDYLYKNLIIEHKNHKIGI